MGPETFSHRKGTDAVVWFPILDEGLNSEGNEQTAKQKHTTWTGSKKET